MANEISLLLNSMNRILIALHFVPSAAFERLVFDPENESNMINW